MKNEKAQEKRKPKRRKKPKHERQEAAEPDYSTQEACGLSEETEEDLMLEARLAKLGGDI